MALHRNRPHSVNPRSDAPAGEIRSDFTEPQGQIDPYHQPDLRRRSLLKTLPACITSAAAWPVWAQHSPPKPATRPETSSRPVSVALVLGSGGCRGHAHIGVIRVLEEHGLRPDLVVGSSAGSLVGALYAAGLGAHELEKYGGQMDSQMMREWKVPRLGMFGGDRISRFVNARVGRRTIASLPTRYAAVATDLRTGELVTLDSGDLATAVQASSSAPGLLEPVSIGKRLCVDGSLVAPVPVAIAHSLGARAVIACDVTFPPLEADLMDPFDALYQGFSILTRRLAVQQRTAADVVIAPRIPVHRDMKAATVAALMYAGETATRDNLDAIKALFVRAG